MQSLSHTEMCKVCLTALKNVEDAGSAESLNFTEYLLSEVFVVPISSNLVIWLLDQIRYFLIIISTHHPQYAHDVVLTFMRRRFNVRDVVWTSKRLRVLTGYRQK